MSAIEGQCGPISGEDDSLDWSECQSRCRALAYHSLLMLTLTFCCQKSHQPGLHSFSLYLVVSWLFIFTVYLSLLKPHPLCVPRAHSVPLTQSITVTHCFNVQLHIMCRAHNVLSLLIHWGGHFPLNSPLFLSSSSCAFSSSSPPPSLGPIRPHLHGNRQWG